MAIRASIGPATRTVPSTVSLNHPLTFASEMNRPAEQGAQLKC